CAAIAASRRSPPATFRYIGLKAMRLSNVECAIPNAAYRITTRLWRSYAIPGLTQSIIIESIDISLCNIKDVNGSRWWGSQTQSDSSIPAIFKVDQENARAMNPNWFNANLIDARHKAAIEAV